MRGQHDKMPCKGSCHTSQAAFSVIWRPRQRTEEHGVCWSELGMGKWKGKGKVKEEREGESGVEGEGK